MGRDKLRKCMVKIGFEEQNAFFHRWYDSYAHGNPRIYGLVELENGKITGVSAGDVRFVDMNGKDMIERNGRNVEGD